MISPEKSSRRELHYSDEEELVGQEVLGEWAESHTSKLTGVLEYNPDRYPYQRLEVVVVEPVPSLEEARIVGEVGMGKEGYNKLIEDLRQSGLIQKIIDRFNSRQSTLMASAHLNNILDTPASHNAAFVAAGFNNFAYKNVIVANHMVKRMTLYGIAVPEILAYSGYVIFGHPPEGALQHGMPQNIINSGNKAFAPMFKHFLDNGALAHRALSDTRAKDIVLPDGIKAKMLPRADDSITNIVRKKMPLAVGVPMDLEPGLGSARVLDPVSVENIDDLHYLMNSMADSLTEMTGERVCYGLPEGARLVEDKELAQQEIYL